MGCASRPLKRSLSIGVVVLAGAGCTAACDQQYLTSREAQATRVMELPGCDGSQKAEPCDRQQVFYVVVPEQLSRLKGASSLTYLGTRDGHHFFKTWNKILTPPQIDHVAVPEELCDVRRRQPLARGTSTQHEVDLTRGGCVVR